MTRYTEEMLEKMVTWAGIVWFFGGGFAISILLLAISGWRLALGCFAIWILSLIGAVAYRYMKEEM